jgi:peptide/nickel transport system substrate-binding protein
VELGRKSPAVLIVGVLAALSLVATGCKGSAPKEEAKDVASTAVDINQHPRDQIQDGGTITIALDTAPAGFNINHAGSGSADAATVMGPILPGSFNTDNKAEFHPDPNYLLSAELRSTDPQQVVVYKINPKAAWYDGTPIDWKAFVTEWQVHNGTNTAYEVRGTTGYEDIEKVERGGDDREVIVTFKKKFVDWKNLFGGLYPPAAFATPELFNSAYKTEPPPSAGPFKFESYNRTTQVITLVRNEKWWGNPAKLDRIVYRVIKPDAQIDALVNGEIDTLDIGPDASKYARAKAAPGIDLRTAGGPNYRHLTFNGKTPALSDVRVRRAVGLGINRQTIANAALKPVNLPAVTLGNHIFMRNLEAYQDNAGEFNKRDVAAAGRLLDEAGWKLDGAVRKKDGQELKLRLVIPSEVQVSKDESQLIQQQLKDVGIVIDIVALPTTDFLSKAIPEANFDLVLFSWLGTATPLSSAKSNHELPTTGPDGTVIARQNFGQIGSKEIDDLFDQATTEFDKEKAGRIGNQIDTLIWKEVHSITFYQRPDIVAVKSTLANTGASGFQSTPGIEDVGFVKAGAPAG